MTLTKHPRFVSLGTARVPRGCPGTQGAAARVRDRGYRYVRVAARWVDLELPPTESTSWWRLDGYSTDFEQEEDKEHDEEDEEQDEAMAVDDNDDE